MLASEINLSAFDQILTKALPGLLRSTLQGNTNDKNDSETVISSHQQALLQQKIARVQQLIDDCLNRLEKAASQQYQSGTISSDTLQSVTSTVKSKLSQAQYLLDSGFFKL